MHLLGERSSSGERNSRHCARPLRAVLGRGPLARAAVPDWCATAASVVDKMTSGRSLLGRQLRDGGGDIPEIARKGDHTPFRGRAADTGRAFWIRPPEPIDTRTYL